MYEQLEKMNKAVKLAEDILRLSRNTLLVNLRFLDMALSMLRPHVVWESTLLTDGKELYYNPRHLLASYKAEKEMPVRNYLHVVIHCVFRHMFVEPLEYKDVKRIREFVIAIDTSGSTSGELVQKFVQKTYNILKSTESFFSKINLHIIQCDAEIQEHVKITNQVEFDRYISAMEIYGLGGTDFRPVFTLVDKLIEQREFTNLKGLVYFTDGYGDFPARKPNYETAFVFVDDEYNNPNVPPWAIKLVLQKDEI